MKGKVKFFNEQTGFGFVAGEDGKEYFVHSTGLSEGAKITEDDAVEFEVEEGDRGPKAVKVKVNPHHGGQPALTPTDSPAYLAAADAMETTFGTRPIPHRGGGSIPIIAMFEKELGIKTVLMGFGLDSDAIHSPNEHFGLFNFYKGIETIPHFYKNYANRTE